MNFWEALFVGVIQGVFEWLPVSSEAVLTLAMTQLFGTDPSRAVNASIFLHTGTMLAAFIYFRKEYLEILIYGIGKLKEPRELVENPSKVLNETEGSLTVFLGLSTFLTGIIGGLVYFTGLGTAVKNPDIFYVLMSAALFITGVLRLYSSSESRQYSDIGLIDTVFSGFLQGFSIIPGISRSGTTAFAFLYRDFDAKSAFHLSFLMSVPVILLGNIGLELFTQFSFQPIYLLSATVAGIVGYLTIETVLKVADRAEISWICFGLAILAILPLIL